MKYNVDIDSQVFLALEYDFDINLSEISKFWNLWKEGRRETNIEKISQDKVDIDFKVICF